MKLKSQILFDEKTIRTQVKRVAEEIARDFGGDDTDLVCVCVLRGAVMFYADLMKELTLENVVYDFVTLQSYESARIDGGTMGTTGVIKLIQELRTSVEGKNVIVVEDIVDSGYTVEYLRRYFKDKNAKNVRIAALLDKPLGRKVEAKADYLAFTLERNAFIIGYGLDCDQKYRNLPGIYEVV